MYTPSFTYRDPIFQPAMRVIAGMTTTDPIEITTTVPHLYRTGLIVRLDVPPGFGMQQANQQTGEIIVTSDTTFIIPVINAVNYDTFVLPTNFPPPYQDAQVVPIGENNLQLDQAVQNTLPFRTLP